MRATDDLSAIVAAIDPAECSYQEWLSVGLVLRDAGHSVDEWDTWSKVGDPDRYHPGECARKWSGFCGSATPITAGTLVRIARSQGHEPLMDAGHELEWGEDHDDLPELPMRSLAEEWDLTDAELAALEAVDDAFNDAFVARQTRADHERLRSRDAEDRDDGLGEPTWFSDAVRIGLPLLAPPLIDGVLRQGHKLMLAGGSKASKSFALIGLAVAITEGREWLGWQCTKGRVLYVNLEIDEASCLDRFDAVYKALGITPEPVQSLAVWNLRGKAMAIAALVPKLIARARRIEPLAIIIDPIYKVMPGDENSAKDMALFCNELDRLADELGAAIITCHHHSKGAQGQKASADRASGSGVFARDADALLDMIQLEKTPDLVAQQLNTCTCEYLTAWLDRRGPRNWRETIAPDAWVVADHLRTACREILPTPDMNELIDELAELETAVREYKALRVEGTLREYRSFQPRYVWFRHPVHMPDTEGLLRDLQARGEAKRRETASPEETRQRRKVERATETSNAFDVCAVDGSATLSELAEYLGTTTRTVRTRVNEMSGFKIDDAVVTRKSGEVK